MQMSTKQVFLALALVTVLGLAAPRAQAQIVGGGGYIGFGTPGFGGAVSFGTPVVPYVAPYPVVVPRPVYAAPFYGAGWWGYGPRYYGPRYYRGYGYRRW